MINLKKCIFSVLELPLAGLKELRNYTGILKSRCCDKCKNTNKCYRSKRFYRISKLCLQFIPSYAELTELLCKLTR